MSSATCDFPKDGLLRFADGRFVGSTGGDSCPDCGHQKRWHGGRFGCSAQLGSDNAHGGAVLQMLLGPCGCKRWQEEQA